jgi:hypothetical protein
VPATEMEKGYKVQCTQCFFTFDITYQCALQHLQHFPPPRVDATLELIHGVEGAA